MTYFAVLVTTHIGGLPAGLHEPSGVFTSLEDARQHIRETNEEWLAVGYDLHPSGNVRVYEYATRKEAEQADVADGMVLGRVGGRDIVSGGRKPLHIHSL